jgi:hypothetical protein
MSEGRIDGRHALDVERDLRPADSARPTAVVAASTSAAPRYRGMRRFGATGIRALQDAVARCRARAWTSTSARPAEHGDRPPETALTTDQFRLEQDSNLRLPSYPLGALPLSF